MPELARVITLYNPPSFYVPMQSQQDSADRLVKENPSWQLRESDIPGSLPSLDGLGPTEFWVLCFYFPRKNHNSTTLETFRNHLVAIAKQTPIYGRDKRLVITPDSVLSLNSQEHEPGIYWRIFDYAAGSSVNNIRNEYPVGMWASSEVLSVQMLMPKWVKSMNGLDIPYAAVSGYKVYSNADSNWRNVMLICPRRAMFKDTDTANMVDISRTNNLGVRPGWSSCLVK